MDQSPSSPGGATLAAFTGAVVIGGTNFVAVRFSNEDLYAIALMPVVTVTLGSILADEPITIELVAGVVLVMLAVYIGAITPRAPASTSLPEAAAGATD